MATTIATCCFISYLFTISLRHLYQGDKMRQLEWDLATITAGDYTVELEIDSDDYRHWYNHEYKKPRGDFENDVSPALSLKNHLIEQIENALTQELQRSPPHANAQGALPVKAHGKRDRPAMAKVEIADIVFSFRNGALIEALRKRGRAIARNNFPLMREHDRRVNELFLEFDSLTVPVSAFITFEEEDGRTLALKNNT